MTTMHEIVRKKWEDRLNHIKRFRDVIDIVMPQLSNLPEPRVHLNRLYWSTTEFGDPKPRDDVARIAMDDLWPDGVTFEVYTPAYEQTRRGMFVRVVDLDKIAAAAADFHHRFIEEIVARGWVVK